MLRSTVARKAGTFRVLARNGNLRLRPGDFRGVITTGDWAKVDEGVLFLSLIGEPSWPPLLSSQVHLDMVIWTNRDCGLRPFPSKYDVENPVHMFLQCDSQLTQPRTSCFVAKPKMSSASQ